MQLGQPVKDGGRARTITDPAGQEGLGPGTWPKPPNTGAWTAPRDGWTRTARWRAGMGKYNMYPTSPSAICAAAKLRLRVEAACVPARVAWYVQLLRPIVISGNFPHLRCVALSRGTELT